jgi:hypothetical protein
MLAQYGLLQLTLLFRGTLLKVRVSLTEVAFALGACVGPLADTLTGIGLKPQSIGEVIAPSARMPQTF